MTGRACGRLPGLAKPCYICPDLWYYVVIHATRAPRMTAKPPAVSETGDPLLLTPGPLTTGKRVKEVMVHDWGSRDAAFLKINADVLARLPELVNGAGDYVQ